MGGAPHLLLAAVLQAAADLAAAKLSVHCDGSSWARASLSYTHTSPSLSFSNCGSLARAELAAHNITALSPTTFSGDIPHKTQYTSASSHERSLYRVSFRILNSPIEPNFLLLLV